MAPMASEVLLAQTAREVADAKEKSETHLNLVDGVSSQERMCKYSQMPHLLINETHPGFAWVG